MEKVEIKPVNVFDRLPPHLASGLTTLSQVMRDGREYTNKEIEDLMYEHIGPAFYHVREITARLRYYNAIDYSKEVINRRRSNVVFTKNNALAASAIVLEIAEKRKSSREQSDIRNVVLDVKKKLEGTSLYDLIHEPPDPKSTIAKGRKRRTDYGAIYTSESDSLRRRMITQEEKALNYISDIKDEDLETAREWTAEHLTEKLKSVPFNYDYVRFDQIPREIQLILIRIKSVKKRIFQNPEDELDRFHFSNNDLKVAMQVTLDFLNKYPDISNLEELVKSIQRKFRAEVTKQNSQTVKQS